MTSAKAPAGSAAAGLNIYQRMLAIMGDIESIEKGKTARVQMKSGGEYTYKFVSHDAVALATHSLFVKHGVYPNFTVLREQVDIAEGLVILTIGCKFVNVDAPDEQIISDGVGIGQGTQGPGIAYSYAVKMILLKSLLLESGEPDGEDDNPGGDFRGRGRGGAKGAPKDKPKAEQKPIADKGVKLENVEALAYAMRRMYEGWGTIEQDLGEIGVTDWEADFIGRYMEKYNDYGDGCYVTIRQAEAIDVIWTKVKAYYKTKASKAGAPPAAGPDVGDGPGVDSDGYIAGTYTPDPTTQARLDDRAQHEDDDLPF